MQNLWVFQKCSSPGHCRPNDKNLQSMFNNSAENCFKLRIVQSVLNKSSLMQERKRCHKNLRDEFNSIATARKA